MRQSVLRVLLFSLLFSLYAINVQASVGKDPYKFFFNETWNDFAEELQKARDEGKQAILLFFEMDECPFCHRMKETVLNQPEVQAYFREHFLNFAVDIEGDVEIVDFAGNPTTQKDFATKVHQVRATPVFAFFDLEGNTIVRFTGATSSIEEFMWLGEFVSQGLYKDMKFTKYKRERRQKKN